jgi:hypothetical protein
VLSLARMSRNVFCKEVVARSADSMLIVGFDPGACAPVFMLASAPRTYPETFLLLNRLRVKRMGC